MSSKTTMAKGRLRPDSDASDASYESVYVWEWPVRLFHWATAGAITALFITGLLISNPTLTSEGPAWEVMTVATIRKIHYIAAFVFLIGFLCRVYWFFFGNTHARSGMPRPWRADWWGALVSQIKEYLTFEFGTPDLGHNALAGLSYTIFIIGLGLLQMLTGFALYSETSPDGFWASLTGWVLPLLGGSAQVHAWHHLFAWGFLIFVILHTYIVILDARQYRNGLVRSMITGFKVRKIPTPMQDTKDGEHDEERGRDK